MTGRLAPALAGLGLAVLVSCGLALLHQSGEPDRAAAAGTAATPSAGVIAPPQTSEGIANTPHARPPASDARLTLPRIAVDARVIGVELNGSVMQVPRNPRVVGWWRGGAVPGAPRGSAVMVGHVDYGGVTGAFARLADTRPGDLVTLSDPALRFRVAAIRSYAKTSGIPAAVFARDGSPRLVLITCGGTFDAATGNYADNIVVYADPVAASRP